MAQAQQIPAMIKLREQCLKRGAAGIKGLSRAFRIMDDNRSLTLEYDEFHKGLADYGIEMSDADIKTVFQKLDKDGSGNVDFDEFLVAIRPPMSAARLKIIDQAFKKLDKTGDGIVTVDDLKGVYNARQHPKYQNGELTETQIFHLFLKAFEAPNEVDGKVTKEEFLNYYSGVSASVDTDAYFDLMMRNSWKL